MSSDEVISRFEELMDKACQLDSKGHLLTAAEKYGRASEAARALGPDNLLTLTAQMRQMTMLLCYVKAVVLRVSAADSRTLAAHRAECVVLLVGAVDALARRRVAGTLLDGKCSSEEVAWFGSKLEKLNPNSQWILGMAPLVGYELFMQGAINTLELLEVAHEFAAECSFAQLQYFAQHVVVAAEWMKQPRRHGDFPTVREGEFTSRLRDTVAHSSADGLDSRLVQLLAGALKRLECSGVLQVRRIEVFVQDITSMHAASAAATAKSLSATDRRSCALAGCGAKEAHPQHFKRCAACHAAAYCCREHQVAHWSAHKAACKAARKVDGGT